VRLLVGIEPLEGTRSSALLGSMALRASGRLWMTVQTEPDFSMRTAMAFPLWL